MDLVWAQSSWVVIISKLLKQSIKLIINRSQSSKQGVA